MIKLLVEFSNFDFLGYQSNFANNEKLLKNMVRIIITCLVIFSFDNFLNQNAKNDQANTYMFTYIKDNTNRIALL